jgi:hypothetical protein
MPQPSRHDPKGKSVATETTLRFVGLDWLRPHNADELDKIAENQRAVGLPTPKGRHMSAYCQLPNGHWVTFFTGPLCFCGWRTGIFMADATDGTARYYGDAQAMQDLIDRIAALPPLSQA